MDRFQRNPRNLQTVSGGRSTELQNLVLVWVDSNIDANKKDFQHTLAQLRSVIYSLKTYNALVEAIAFIEGIQQERVLLITSGALGKQLVPRIHDLGQVKSIYIFCSATAYHRKWTQQWKKVRGVENRVEPVCEKLRADLHQSNQDDTPISIVSPSLNAEKQGLDQLNPLFMYTQLLKNALIHMERDRAKEMQTLVAFLRDRYQDDQTQLDLINEFERDYRPEQALWWYTREGFTYQLLNQGLRELDAGVIVDMVFFLQDIHQQIVEQYLQQIDTYKNKEFDVYRGQGLPNAMFEQLQAIRVGCSLSTALSRRVPKGVWRKSWPQKRPMTAAYVPAEHDQHR
jgi:hypothetical protein